MYAFSLSDSTGKNAGGTVLELPAYEVNYGAAPGLQLHLVLPPTVAFLPAARPLLRHRRHRTRRQIPLRQGVQARPRVGIFPFFELPSGNADKGLGVGKTWYRMPLWFQKSWGPEDTQWTTYGGGGETIVPQDGYKNFPFAGWLVQKQINKKISLGAELFGHGAEGPAALSTRASTLLDLGGIYEFHDGFDLLFATGRGVYGQPETYTYVSLYWTWGPKDAAKDSADKTQPATGSKMLSALTRLRPQ